MKEKKKVCGDCKNRTSLNQCLVNYTILNGRHNYKTAGKLKDACEKFERK